ncbi:MAG: ABC transporter ATP-binding protein [Actinobacteria bacterium]|nr:ABC transporter ATP-binding protein [Actinomycetota bacterium]
MSAMLEVRDMSIRFGGLQALEGVDLDVGEWEIVGLIGPNGAGKTTLFNCMTGIYGPDTGTVAYRGQDLTELPTHRRVAMGMGRTWQNLGVVRSLTVLENVLTAQHAHAGYHPISGILGLPATFVHETQARRDAREILDFLGLLSIANERVGDLPYGTQKLCDLAMALATDPEILLLDEPSSGMGPEEAHHLGETLRFFRDALNLTILMIEHHVPLVVGVCDYVYVLNFGRILARGLPEDVQRHPEVIAAYLGEEAGEEAGLDPGTQDTITLPVIQEDEEVGSGAPRGP